MQCVYWPRTPLGNLFGQWAVASYINSTTYFNHVDWLGNIRARTDVHGTRIKTCTNLPFGDLVQCAGSGLRPQHFTGLNQDSETAGAGSDTGLHHTWYRQLSSYLGRWMTPDPAGMAAVDPGNPQTWNRYAYVNNNPTNAIDPSGMAPRERCGVARDGEYMCTPLTEYGNINSGAGSVMFGLDEFDYAMMGAGISPGLYTEGRYQAQVDEGFNRLQPGYSPPTGGPGYNIWVNCGGTLTNVNCPPPPEAMGGSSTFSTNLLYPGLAPGDVPAGSMSQGVFQGQKQTWQQSSMTGNIAAAATAVVIVGVPVFGETLGAIAACNPGLNVSYGHVTVYCRAWMPGNLIGIGYDPKHGAHINVGNSIHIPLWPWH